MRGKDPAEDWPNPILAEPVGDQAHGRRHGRHPIQAVKHDEGGQRGHARVVGQRQEQQRDAAQRVVPDQQLARIHAVRQPARERRAEQVEHAHGGQHARRGDFGHAVLDRSRDEVHRDQADGRRAADGEAARRAARSRAPWRSAPGYRPPAQTDLPRGADWRDRGDGAVVFSAVGLQANLARVVAHEHARPAPPRTSGDAARPADRRAPAERSR